MDKWRLLGALIVGTAAAAALAACSPGAHPVVTDTPSTVGSETASPSPTASVDVLAALPVAARSDDLDGAIATAEFFLTLYAPMFHTGDTRLWEALSTDACTYCQGASDNAARVRDGGWKATGGEITPAKSSATATAQGDDGALVSLEAGFADAYLTASGSTPELQESAGADAVHLRMLFKGGLWLVDGVMIGDT